MIFNFTKLKNENLIILLIVVLLLFASGCTKGNSVEDNKQLNENFQIDISELSTTAKYYTYSSGGIDIRYFAVLGSDGEPRVAFDACDVCGGSKGYAQSGDQMVCRNCGQRFDIDNLGVNNKGGGCWPSHLEHQIEGNNIIIDSNDLMVKKYTFT